MKHFVIAILGCIPLLWLTILNIAKSPEPADGQVRERERIKIDEKGIEERVAAVTNTSPDELKAIRGLVSIDPFSTRPAAFAAGESVPADVKPVQEAWKEYEKARGGVGELAAIYHGKLQPQREVDDLEKFLEKDRFKDVRGGDAVKGWCQSRVTNLKAAMLKDEKLKTIREKYKTGDYKAVLQLIDELPLALLGDVEREEIKKLKPKAVFLKHWNAIYLPNPVDGESAKSRLTKLVKHLTESPPPADSEDREFMELQLVEKLNLQRQVRVFELFKEPPEQVIDLAEQMEQVFREDQESRRRLVDGLRKWLSERLNKKSAPKFETDEQETWEVSGQYRRGVFKKSLVPNKYLYWSDPKSLITSKHQKEFYLKELTSEPQPMLEIRLCDAFNKNLDSLQKKLHDKREWEKFADSCEKMQDEITQYYSKISDDKRKVNFEAEAKLARDVLTQWPKLSEILK